MEDELKRKEDELKNDPNYKDGYHEGKHVAEMMPRLAEIFDKIKAETPYQKGLQAGKADYIKEQKYKNDKYLPWWMKQNPDYKMTKHFNEKAKDNRPDIEPEL